MPGGGVLFKSQCESNEIGRSMSTEKVEWGETLSFDFTKVKVGLTCAVKPLAVEDCQNRRSRSACADLPTHVPRLTLSGQIAFRELKIIQAEAEGSVIDL